MDLLRRLVEKCGWIPDHTFFVLTPYNEAFRRLNKRGREAEKNIKLDFLQQLELRHKAFIHSGLCGKIHLLDGSLGKNELLASAMEKIKAIRRSKSSNKWPSLDPPQFDWELEAKWARMILGPLPALITRTLRGQHPISANRPTCKSSTVRCGQWA